MFFFVMENVISGLFEDVRLGEGEGGVVIGEVGEMGKVGVGCEGLGWDLGFGEG